MPLQNVAHRCPSSKAVPDHPPQSHHEKMAAPTLPSMLAVALSSARNVREVRNARKPAQAARRGGEVRLRATGRVSERLGEFRRRQRRVGEVESWRRDIYWRCWDCHCDENDKGIGGAVGCVLCCLGLQLSGDVQEATALASPWFFSLRLRLTLEVGRVNRANISFCKCRNFSIYRCADKPLKCNSCCALPVNSTSRIIP